jgi:hypothetical protein
MAMPSLDLKDYAILAHRVGNDHEPSLNFHGVLGERPVLIILVAEHRFKVEHGA